MTASPAQQEVRGPNARTFQSWVDALPSPDAAAYTITELCRSAWLDGAAQGREEAAEWTRAFRAYQSALTDEEQRAAAWWLNDLKTGNGYCHQPPCAVEIQDRTIRSLEARIRDLEECLRQSFVLLERLGFEPGDDVGCQLD